MPEPFEEAVIEALRHVFETSAFMSVWPWDEESVVYNDEPAISASMEFHGPIHGRIVLSINRSVLTSLVENMLGDLPDSEHLEDRARDAIKETLNMVCGNWLTSWYGEDRVFNLSPPVVLEEPIETAQNPEYATPFLLEGTRGDVAVYTERSS